MLVYQVTDPSQGIASETVWTGIIRTKSYLSMRLEFKSMCCSQNKLSIHPWTLRLCIGFVGPARNRRITFNNTQLRSPHLITLIQRKSTQHIKQPLIVVRLDIPPPIIKTTQVVGDISTIELSHLESIPQKRESVVVSICDVKIFIPRLSHNL